MRFDAYLRRIRYDGPTVPTEETLRALHRAHMMAVPFENLDIHLGVPIQLSVPAFFEKIVTRSRGGFCYELNGLFAWLLAELGYRVTLVSARVASASGLSPEFDHLALVVDLTDRWVADVGFGDSSLDPLRLKVTRDEETPYSLFENAGLWTIRHRQDGIWQPHYAFELHPRRLDEFEARCAFQQTSPESHFTQNTICSLATPFGRTTLAGRKLIVTSHGQRDEREVRTSEEYRSVLKNGFGIELSVDEADRLITSLPAQTGRGRTSRAAGR